jgi:heme oxygenase (biliverdin-IX-beta and delta-forming)
MLSERLKNETHQSHVDVEKLILPRVKNLDSKSAYASLLKLFYGYFKPIEDKVDKVIDEQILPDYNERRKASVIAQDMAKVNDEKCEKICSDLPEITSPDHALGALYVMEGSTLGGKVLTKMITERMQLTPDEGVRFFNGYGADTFSKWHAFKEHLNNYSSEKQVQDTVVNAANETFIKFKNWIENH